MLSGTCLFTCLGLAAALSSTSASALEPPEASRLQVQLQAQGRQVARQANAHAKAGRWVQAVRLLTAFRQRGVHGVPFAPDSEQTYLVRFGIADALARAGLLQSAADGFLQVLLQGPDKVHFDAAFQRVRALRQQIDFKPPELERVGTFSVVGKPPAVRNSFHYAAGQFLHEYGLVDQALLHLRRVEADAMDFPRARYLLGLIAFEEPGKSKVARLKGAIRAFQEAVIAGERSGQRGVVDLAWMALARAAYEHGQYDAAIYYYRKIGPRSPRWGRALYEAGWSYFLKRDVSRALGSFHALHSPYFKRDFHPELWIMEAALYVQTCHVSHAEKAMASFEGDVLTLGPPVRDFLALERSPERVYRRFVAAANNGGPRPLPRRVIGAVLQNADFFALHRTIRQVEKEQALISAQLARLPVFGPAAMSRLKARRAELVAEAGVVVERALRGVQRDIARYHDRLQELRIDLREIEIMFLDIRVKNRKRAAKKGPDAHSAAGLAPVERGGVIAMAGSESMVWPFEGEFWRDEVGAYRSFLTSRCHLAEAGLDLSRAAAPGSRP